MRLSALFILYNAGLVNGLLCHWHSPWAYVLIPAIGAAAGFVAYREASNV